jgi:hypothetical protein
VSDTELLHKSKPEPVRRLEVFTGAGRRRTWTAEQKAQNLAESYESGEKVVDQHLMLFQHQPVSIEIPIEIDVVSTSLV